MERTTGAYVLGARCQMTLYDYPVSDQMKALGFSRVYKKDKNLVVYNSPALITSRYFSGDLQSTLHRLEKALIDYDKLNNNHFGNEKRERDSYDGLQSWDTKTDEAQEDAAEGSSETRYSSEGTYS